MEYSKFVSKPALSKGTHLLLLVANLAKQSPDLTPLLERLVQELSPHEIHLTEISPLSNDEGDTAAIKVKLELGASLTVC